MASHELDRILSLLGDLLPEGRVLVLTRRAVGDRRVTSVRGDAEAVAGHAAKALERETARWVECLHPEDREGYLEGLLGLSGAEPVRLEYRVVDPSGRVRWLREHLKFARPSARDAPEAVGLLTDVTFERTVRGRLSGLERELWRSRKLESLGAMASGVAHDFNNLLTVILASSDLLDGAEGLPETAETDLELIRDSARRGSELVRQILSFAARAPSRTSSVKAGDLLDDLEGILRRVAGHGVDVSLEVDPDAWTIEVDPAHLEQIVLNLTVNARDAMPDGGRLVIEVQNRTVRAPVAVESGSLAPGRYVRVSVRDTGSGMTPEVRRRIFEPHYSTKREEPGAALGGFGLATVLRLVRGYDGGIGVASDPGAGSTFQVYLPVRASSGGAGGYAGSRRVDVGTPGRRGASKGTAVDRLSVAEVLEDEGSEDPRPGRGRILVVEGDPSIRDEVTEILGRDGHSVASASTASEGLRIFDRARPPFDLLLTEIVLPDRSGHDLWRAGRKRVADLGVVFLSGHDRATVALEGVDGTERSVVTKPIDPERLKRVVLEVLDDRDPDRDGRSDAGEVTR